MASCIWTLLTYLAYAQISPHTVTIVPKTDDSRTGGVVFREKRANGTNTVEWSAPDAITTTQRYRWPSGNASGFLFHDGSGNTSWSASAIDPHWEFDGSGNFRPTAGSGVTVGTTGQPVDDFIGQNVTATSQVRVSVGGIVRGAITSGGLATANSSGTQTFSVSSSTGDVAMNGVFAIKSGIITRLGADVNGFTLTNSLGIPTIVAFSGTGALGAAILEAGILRVTGKVEQNLIPDGAGQTLGNSSFRWDAWLDDISANTLAVGSSATIGGSLTVGGTFSPSSISTSTLTVSGLTTLGRFSASSFDGSSFTPFGTSSLGTSTTKWNDLHVNGGTVYNGGLTFSQSSNTSATITQSLLVGNRYGEVTVYNNGAIRATMNGLTGKVAAIEFVANAFGSAETGVSIDCGATTYHPTRIVGGIIVGGSCF